MATIFGNNKEKNTDLDWNILDDIKQLDDLVELSNDKTVVIFKHSTRCGISRAVKKAFEKQFKDKDAIFYYLDLLKHRDISNEIASRFNVQHQSPQLLVLKGEKVVKHDSHYDLLAVEI